MKTLDSITTLSVITLEEPAVGSVVVHMMLELAVAQVLLHTVYIVHMYNHFTKH